MRPNYDVSETINVVHVFLNNIIIIRTFKYVLNNSQLSLFHLYVCTTEIKWPTKGDIFFEEICMYIQMVSKASI